MECPDCGAIITREDMFCGECGRPLEGMAASAEPVTPADVRDRVTETVDLPAARPAPKKSSRRLLPLILAGVGFLFLCGCAVLVAGLFLIRAGSDSAPVLVLEVTATPEMPESGSILYADDFSDPASGWDVFDEDGTSGSYAGGEYRIGVFQPDYMAWGNSPGQELANFTIEVDARTVEGPLDNNFGVLVRYQGGGSDFYWFQISADGYYAVDMMAADEWAGLVDWVPSDAINQGLGATNHLKVVSNGDLFEFYVNDTYLTSVSDASFSSGDIGLAVGTFDEPGAVVHFDNLVVYDLQE